jgi:hypothetical protein
MGATRNVEKIGVTAQTMVKASQESATAMWDYVVRVHLQTELSQDVTKELF